MMKRAVVALVALTCASCGDSPTMPTRISSAPSASKATASVGYVFDPKQLGHAVLNGKPYTVGVRELPGVCYQRDFFTYNGAPLFIVWNAADRINQVDAGHDPDNGERFTMSDFANGPIAADEHLWCIPGAPPATPTTPPVPPKPPVPPVDPPKLPPPPQCTGGGSFTFPADSYVAVFPRGFPDPWYPSRIALSVNIPVGRWVLTALNGDDHSVRDTPEHPEYPDGKDHQLHESGTVDDGVGGSVQTGPTNDVQPRKDEIYTVLGTYAVTRPITVLYFTSAGRTFVDADGIEQPNDSVRIISLAYACPVGALR